MDVKKESGAGFREGNGERGSVKDYGEENRRRDLVKGSEEEIRGRDPSNPRKKSG